MKKRLLLMNIFLVAILLIGSSIYFFKMKVSNHKAIEAVTVQILPERTQLIERKRVNIIGLGDSLTVGVGDPSSQGYIGIVKEKLEMKNVITVHLKNEAKKGLRSEQLVKKLKKKKLREDVKEADVIFLSLGGNDIMNVFKNHFFHLNVHLFEKQSEDFASNLKQIMHLIRKENTDVPVVMIGLFNPYFTYFSEIVEINQIIHIWNTESKEVLSQFNDAYFVEIDSIFSNDNDVLLHEDNFHPNREGYERIAETVMKELHEQQIIR
ncbi:GDSL-type esterase/lipase family protein [Pueribacillus sp. YX66]|uniref:GDSL-type esterase/lipase family protein n=1 Tax=Pueribacillus sp. YX66 TaxID=3229242 RepID=UPI00358CFF1D